MVLRKFDSLAVLADHATRVACIGNIHVSRGDQHDISRAACLVRVVLPRHIVRLLPANPFQLFSAGWSQEHLVNFDEDVGEGLLVVLVPEVLVILQFFHEMSATELCHFCSAMAVEDREQ